MRIAIAQRNPIVGDLQGNARLAIDAADEARAQGAHILLLSEMFLTGYPPRDLLTRPHFIQDVVACARSLASNITGITLLLGSPWPHDVTDLSQGLHNSLLVIRDGTIADVYHKQLLPTYDVFDEDRYFLPGTESRIITIDTIRIGLSICEDLWRGKDAGTSPRYRNRPDPIEQLARAGAHVVLNASASPFSLAKDRVQRAMLREHCARHSLEPTGARLIAAGKPFAEDLLCFNIPTDTTPDSIDDPLMRMDWPEQLFHALVLGARDYYHKTGHSRAIIGLSGGIDSALTACIASRALGSENIIALSMPGHYSSQGSITDARTLADSLAIRMLDVPITSMHDAASDSLTAAMRSACAAFDRDVPPVADENIQSRLRGLSVMSVANSLNALALVTGNKSEMAVGYATLYGDMSGGLCVLSDVTKTRVYDLSRWINEHHDQLGFQAPPIPESSITKPPSAELRPDQTDQDSLPPYEILDEIIERYVEQLQDPDTIESLTDIPRETIDRIVRMIDINEFKRQQAPIGLKVTRVAFGCGRRHPVAQRYSPGRILSPTDDARSSASPARR
ncbi:MAG: NAD(+) synthase [Planctomycetota bacterium]|jgi:NAD+ synthetase